ncbi:hypothetical protein FH972_026582 [Carpinus fangiana]|uniref:Uncharacterized protein n=1 Tax=Carpinus fangiana TaxID=176857 RepID=A0A5N6L4I9_9ROSI|nr:hypothetical protein FH972_026582 [Carpinus fangiana]
MTDPSEDAAILPADQHREEVRLSPRPLPSLPSIPKSTESSTGTRKTNNPFIATQTSPLALNRHPSRRRLHGTARQRNAAIHRGADGSRGRAARGRGRRHRGVRGARGAHDGRDGGRDAAGAAQRGCLRRESMSYENSKIQADAENSGKPFSGCRGVVAVRVGGSAGRGSVVLSSASCGGRLVLGLGVAVADSGASDGGVVRGAVVLSTGVVGGRRAVLLLLLVVARDPELDQGAEEEEEGTDDGDSKSGFVETAREAVVASVGNILVGAGAESAGTKLVTAVGRASANGGDDKASAGVRTAPRQDGEGNESTDKGDIEDNGEEGEEAGAAQAAGEENGKDGVDDGDAADAFDGLPLAGDGDLAVG